MQGLTFHGCMLIEHIYALASNTLPMENVRIMDNLVAANSS